MLGWQGGYHFGSDCPAPECCKIKSLGVAEVGSNPTAVPRSIALLIIRSAISSWAGRIRGSDGHGSDSREEGRMKSRLEAIALWALATFTGAMGAGAVAGLLPPPSPSSGRGFRACPGLDPGVRASLALPYRIAVASRVHIVPTASRIECTSYLGFGLAQA